MEVVKKFSILTILVGNSIFIGCQSDKLLELTIANSDNSFITNLIVDVNGGLTKIDSTNLGIDLNCIYDYFPSELIGDEYLSYCATYNLRTKSLIMFDNLILISRVKDSVYFYDTNNKSISIFDIKNGKLLKNGYEGLEIQIFNNKPAFENISPDFEKMLILKPIINSETSSHNFDVFLKEFKENSEIKLLHSVSGSKIAAQSNAASIPKFIWINSSQFLYSDIVTSINVECLIKKYDISTGASSTIGKIRNLEESLVNYTFMRDNKGEIFYSDGIKMYSIDYRKNKIQANPDFYLGNNFSVVLKKEKFILKFNDKIIGNISRKSNFSLDRRYYKTTNDAIIIKYKQQIESVNVEWKNVCKIWSKCSGWTDVSLEPDIHILSFKNSPR